MKSVLIAAAACAALSGCVGYGGPTIGYGSYGSYGSYGYGYPGSYAYPSYSYPGYAYGGGYYAPAPPVNTFQRGPLGDPDRDGRPNRYDRDRDGDGVRNRLDARPYNPRRS